MDSVTHSVLGACIGELIAGRKMGKKAMLFGALLNNIPDIDVVCYLWMNPTEALVAHRGLTHSILFNIFLSFFLANVLKKMFNKYSLSFNQWIFLISSNLFSHLFLDLFNVYGVGLFEPFDQTRFSFNSLFIIDPLFALPMFISCVVLAFLQKSDPIRLKFAKGALLISSIYLIISVANKTLANKIAEKSISNLGISPSSYFTSPTPFNNLLWYVVVKDRKQFCIGYYSVFDQDSIIHFEKMNKNDSLLIPYKNTKDVQNLIRFSQGYYCIGTQDGSIVFNDIRFGQDEGWNKNNSHFNFHFDLQKDQNNLLIVQRGRFKSFRWKYISGIISRISTTDKILPH